MNCTMSFENVDASFFDMCSIIVITSFFFPTSVFLAGT